MITQCQCAINARLFAEHWKKWGFLQKSRVHNMPRLFGNSSVVSCWGVLNPDR